MSDPEKVINGTRCCIYDEDNDHGRLCDECTYARGIINRYVVSKAEVLDVYAELYDKYVLMFVQALFETFYNEAAAGMEVTVKRRDKDDD